VDNIEIIVEVYLNHPYDESLNFLISLVGVKGMFILQCSTASNKAKVAIPSKMFKMLIGKNPKVGIEAIIKGTEKYIKKIKVIEIKIKKGKDDKNTKSQ
jgi:hypothetical protein